MREPHPMHLLVPLLGEWNGGYSPSLFPSPALLLSSSRLDLLPLAFVFFEVLTWTQSLPYPAAGLELEVNLKTDPQLPIVPVERDLLDVGADGERRKKRK